jgi:IS5 family transposase
VIELRRVQLSFGDGLIAAEVTDLREAWMRHADAVLADEQIVASVYEALAKRHPRSRSRGRHGAPAEVVLRLLVLKHVRNWSYQVLEREVRANLIYRDFTRVGGGKVPDAKTMGRWGVALGPAVVRQIHERLVKIALDRGVVAGRRMRVDTTVVETDIHYPTDSSLLGDGVRVLTRVMKRVSAIAGRVGTVLRDRSRSVKLRVIEIARAARSKGPQSRERLERLYGRLLGKTSRVVGQAKRFSAEIAAGLKRSVDPMKQLVLEGLGQKLDAMLARVRQVMKQTRARLFRGDTRSEGKLFSLFEPSTEIIRKGKAGKPNEFGKMVKLQEAENQIVTDYEVYDRRPYDADLLGAAIDIHEARLGRTPRLVAADAGFYSARNEAAAKARGVKRLCIPNRSTRSRERKREQKRRWFRQGQKWRTGCEGRISVVKRRHGLNRCRYKGDAGMRRWVGFGVIADNLINLGHAIERLSARTA